MPAARPRLLAGAAAVGVAALLWCFFAPPQLGGSTLYSSTVGNSMEPRFHKGDLAVVRPAPSYHAGEIVLYESPVFHRPVLHRILTVQDDRYYFKGDHNTFVDPGYATRAELLGKLWFRVPKAGKGLSWFGKPVHAALLAAVAVAFLLLGGGGAPARRRRRGRKRRRNAMTQLKQRRQGFELARYLHRPRKTPANIAAGIAAAGAFVLLVLGFTTGNQRTVALKGAYRETGTFGYSAQATSPTSAYPTGAAKSGQPLFLRFFRNADFSFSYRFRSDLPHRVHGTASFEADVSSDLDWHHTFTLAPATTFSGDRVALNGSLDLKTLATLVQQLETDTGTSGGEYTVDVRPVVRVLGSVKGKKVDETFAPTLPLTLTQSVLKLDATAPAPLPGATYALPSAADELHSTLDPIQEGSIPVPGQNYVSIARYHLAVNAVRGLGMGLAGLVLLVLFLKPLAPKRETWSPERRVAFRLGCVIVDVVSLGDAHDARTMPDFESLASLARYCERPILREQLGDRVTYGVEDDGRLYLYSRREAAPAPAPALRTPEPVAAEPAPRRPRRFIRAAGALLALGVGASLVTAFTGANTVPASNAGVSTNATAVSQLAPDLCSSVGVTNKIVLTGGTLATGGTPANDLIVGGANAGATYNLSGGGGNDCIVGGGGPGVTNKFDGGPGTGDVCIGAPGATNTFKNCEVTG